MDAKIDWMSFTIPADRRYTFQDFIPGGIEWMGHGWLGYTQMGVFAGCGRVGVSPERPEMGAHFSIPPTAMARMAGSSDFWADLPCVVATVHALGGKVTRLDVAFDDRDGLLDISTMVEYLERRWYVSRWRKAKQIRGFDMGKGAYDGNGWDLGSRASNAMCRIYDKQLERIQAGEDNPGHWVRVELELKRERADAAAQLYASGDEGAFFAELAGVLHGYISFVTPNPNDSNRRRWKPAAWWVAFLDGAEKARLTVLEKVKRTIEHVQDWFARQSSPSVAVVYESMGETAFIKWMLAELKAGKGRWKGRHRAILAASL